MARPRTIDTEEILEAARKLFLERGLDVPTAEIARVAGVSEGSIFKRFPTKQALFFAAMGFEGAPGEWVAGLQKRVGQGEVEQNLRNFIIQGISFFRKIFPRMMMLWSSRIKPLEIHRQMGVESGPYLVLEQLTRYIEGEVNLGRLRASQPEVLARMLLGSTAHFAFFETLELTVRGKLDADEYVRHVVQTLLQGIAPAQYPDDEMR
jgi:AcrR family transcriptional regulator